MAISNVSGSNVSGARIHELRIRLNMSAAYFGRRCNLSTTQQTVIEKGRSPVTEELVAGILKEFGGADPENLRSWLTCETDELHIHGETLINQEEAAIGRLRQVFEESRLSQREFSRRVCCKIKMQKVANQKYRMLQLHFVGFCRPGLQSTVAAVS